MLGTGVADVSGNWSITSSALAQGVHALTAKQTDIAGNTSVASASLSVTIDTTAVPPSAPDLIATSDSGTSSTDNNTSVTTPTFTGSGAESGATVTLFDTNGTTVLGAGVADGSGNWSVTSSTLSTGSHTLTAKQTDIAGNTSAASASLVVTIDTAAAAPSAPDLIAASDSGTSSTDNITNMTAPTLTGSGAESGATVALYDTNGTTVLGTGVANGAGAWTIISSTLGEGAHTLTAKQTDIAGNTSAASTSLVVTIDTTAPAAPGTPDLTTASDSGTSSTDNVTKVTTPTFTGTGVNGTTVTILDGATAVGSAVVSVGAYTITTTALSDGVHSISATTTDLAGNAGTSSALAVTIDTVGPTVTSITPSAGFGNNTSTATFTFNFNEAVQGFATGDATSNRGTIAGISGSGSSYTGTFTRSANGNTTASVDSSYTDIAGNNGSAFTSAGLPAGVAGQPINLALTDPSADSNDLITVRVAGIPTDWTLSSGSRQADDTWLVQTNDPSTLTVITPATFAGALVLALTMTWINADGSAGSAYVVSNVEAYASGNPIFALSADDHLTASSAADLLVFAQPIANDVIHNFDTAADKIDLIGFTGVSGFENLSIADDANGNAVITTSAGSTITVLGVHAADLIAANFEFNLEPVTINAGTTTIADGAILPLGGVIENSGTIALGSAGSETDLQILVESATLQGGGHVVLSDDSHNVIFGGAANATLVNVDNTISGAGQIGAGQMILNNAGTIVADGSCALVLDTASNTIINTGLFSALGTAGMVVASATTGHGSALVGSGSQLTFSAASDADVDFASGDSGTLVLGQPASFTGSITGLLGGDAIALADVLFTASAQLTYTAGLAGGTLQVRDGANAAQFTVVGSYTISDFHVQAGSDGVVRLVSSAADNGTVLGTFGSDVLTGTGGDDIVVGGKGADVLTGGGGSDTFVWRAGDWNAVDTITDFKTGAGGDVLAIGGLLQGYTAGSELSRFVSLESSADGTIVSINATGQGSVYQKLVVLQGVTGVDLTLLAANIAPSNDIALGTLSVPSSGGNGAENLLFLSTTEGIHTITDFVSGLDKIQLENTGADAFDMLATGALSADAFYIDGSTTTADANTRIIYDPTSGQLFYDADGTGVNYQAVQIALMGATAHPALTNTDFQVI